MLTFNLLSPAIMFAFDILALTHLVAVLNPFIIPVVRAHRSASNYDNRSRGKNTRTGWIRNISRTKFQEENDFQTASSEGSFRIKI